MAEQRPEPSMEDILASIKRIIADDPAPPKAPQPAAAPPMAPPQPMVQRAAPSEQPSAWSRRGDTPSPDSVLELTNRAPDPYQPRPSQIRPPEPAPAPVQRAVERLREAEAEMPQPAQRPVPRDLLPRTPAPRPSGGDVTLDGLVREMLQPMLADWIEKNLPDMVERLVQAEIRRMTENG